MVLYSPFVLVPKKDIVNNDLDDNDRSPDKILSKFRQVTKASGTEFITIGDRKSTRLNSSHANISYAVFCLKKKKKTKTKQKTKQTNKQILPKP